MGHSHDDSGRQGYPHCWERHSKMQHDKKRRRVLEHLVSWRIHRLRIPSALRTRLGNSRKMDAQLCSPTQRRLPISNLPHQTRHERHCQELVPYSWSSIWLFSDPRWVNFYFWLLHCQRRRLSTLQTYLPLRLSSMPRCSNFLFGSHRQWGSSNKVELENHWGRRHWRNGWAWCITLWACQECLLVWISTWGSWG